MKELSIEEKAKRYDSAIERAKNTIEVNQTIPNIVDCVESLFPELAESENEKIRKELFAVIDDLILPDKQKERFVAWLEKQSSDISLFSSEQRKYMQKYVSLDKITLIKLLAERDANNAEIIESFEKQGEHANFISKIQIGDKVTRNEDGVLVNLSQLNRIAKKQGEMKEIIPEDATVDSNEDGLIAETIRYKNEKQGEQKPVGFNIGDEITVNGQVCRVVAVDKSSWSEKDETTLNGILSCIKHCQDEDTEAQYNGNRYVNPKRYESMSDWLKSLKDRVQPQSHLKPSDEQIYALRAVVNELKHSDNKYQETIEDLYNDLEKLREE